MARFSLGLRELEAANAFGNLDVDPRPSGLISTQTIMQELSIDSEVTFRRELGVTPPRRGGGVVRSSLTCGCRASVACCKYKPMLSIIIYIYNTLYTSHTGPSDIS